LPSLNLRHFTGAITKGDKKDVNNNACVRQVNMVSNSGQFGTREGCKKLDSTEYTARINMVFHFKRNVGSNKTIVASGGNLYAI
jgi:hypothetical protein